MSTESTVHYCRLSAVTIITLYNFTEEFRVIFCFLAHIYIWVNSLSRLGSSRSLGDRTHHGRSCNRRNWSYRNWWLTQKQRWKLWQRSITINFSSVRNLVSGQIYRYDKTKLSWPESCLIVSFKPTISAFKLCKFFKRLTHFTLVKEALIEIGCVVTSLVVGCHARALWPNSAS